MVWDWIGAMSAAVNAGYFLVYRSPLRRRWLAARVLAVVNLGILGESLRGALGGEGMALGRGLLIVGAMLTSLFILRQLAGRLGCG